VRIALAQVNTTVGDLDGNVRIVINGAQEAHQAGAGLVVFPELVVSGCPPEDLVLKDHFLMDCVARLQEIAAACPDIVALVGVPWPTDETVYNAAAILAGGRVAGLCRKMWPANHGVFDEKRYFASGERSCVLQMDGVRIGLSIGEDIWDESRPGPWSAVEAGATLIVNSSMSPYHMGVGRERAKMLSRRAQQLGAHVCYLNGVGGQDELVFDGQSLVYDATGRLLARARQFEEELVLLDLDLPQHQFALAAEGVVLPAGVDVVIVDRPGHAAGSRASAQGGQMVAASSAAAQSSVSGGAPAGTAVAQYLPREAEVYQALCLGVGDYVRKNGFSQVVLGLSGGVDSALVACVARDVLGGESVTGVSMPSRYSSVGTKSDARETAARLGINFKEIAIEAIFASYLQSLQTCFSTGGMDATEQNIQARIRGNLLMALSNKFGWLVLTTSNKSETAVGYTTLYGDMAGGFAVLKDVPKTLVYELCRYRNSLEGGSGPIPVSTIERAPSAELAENQTDQDTLPPYDLLDRIVEAYVERDESVDGLVDAGFERRVVECVVAMIDGSEYKRRQAAPGVRITPKAFGRDRRLPLTNRYKG
jgi:NAD+ synthase (glutamine-hydrolysing)